MDSFAYVVPRTLEVPALAIHLCAVGIGVFAERVVKDLRLFGVTVHASFSATHAVALDWVGPLDPAGDIQVVDVLLNDLVSADPVEVVPVVALEGHLRGPRLAVAIPDATTVPVDALQDDVANCTVVKTLDGFDVAWLVSAL